jgi:hypothetical protein
MGDKNSWTGFHLNSKVVRSVIFMLRTQHFDLEEWCRLPRIGTHVGTIGIAMSNLWEWTHIYRLPHLDINADASWGLLLESALDSLVEDRKSKLAQCLARLQSLARRSPWT